MKDLSAEFRFSASRSSGPGGQNVNKTASKVELRFHVDNSALLTEEEKTLLKSKLANQLTNESELIVTAQTERSQLRNKEIAVRKFYRLLEKAFDQPKKRKPGKPSLSAVRERLQEKRQHSEKKSQRRGDGW